VQLYLALEKVGLLCFNCKWTLAGRPLATTQSLKPNNCRSQSFSLLHFLSLLFLPDQLLFADTLQRARWGCSLGSFSRIWVQPQASFNLGVALIPVGALQSAAEWACPPTACLEIAALCPSRAGRAGEGGIGADRASWPRLSLSVGDASSHAADTPGISLAQFSVALLPSRSQFFDGPALMAVR